jgi:hypothetical protein
MYSLLLVCLFIYLLIIIYEARVSRHNGCPNGVSYLKNESALLARQATHVIRSYFRGETGM